MPQYSGRLFPVEVGQTITVVGRVGKSAQRIDINLTSGNNQGEDPGDIQLHFSIRFRGNDSMIVRNTHVSSNVLIKTWQKEERSENLFPFNTPNPVKSIGDFKVSFYVDKDAFFASVDDKPFCTFKHRLPIKNIQWIKIEKDFEEIYQVNQRTSSASPWPSVRTNVFQSYAPRPFNAGNVIVITGTPKGSAKGNFFVNFYEGASKNRVHFHFRAYLDRKNIVMNSKLGNGNWQQAITESPKDFPFIMQSTFKLAIAITNSEFLVAANGKRIGKMTFRDPNLLKTLTGFELFGSDGLNLSIAGVEHHVLDLKRTAFEILSK